MTPRTKKRSSLFPAYSPPAQANPTTDEWAEHIGLYIQTIAKRVVAIGSIIVMVGGGGAYATHVGEAKPVDEATTRVRALEDSVSAHNRRITEVERLMRSNIYISCQVLQRVQPATSIQPQECR